MGDKSGIEWTDATWNPVVGCAVVSPGCINCYAMRLAGGRMKRHPVYDGLTQASKVGPVWTGETRLNARSLDNPLRWRRPRRIFVNSMGDVFAESVAAPVIDLVFDVIERAPQHQFQLLTKRPERMRDYMNARYAERDPPAQLMVGTSVEDQARLRARVPALRATKAAARFLSIEPLIGIVDLGVKLDDGARPLADGLIDWVIVGGESGPGARPMLDAWAAFVRDVCVQTKTPFFFKQWGAFRPADLHETPDLVVHGYPMMSTTGDAPASAVLRGRAWRQFPNGR